MTTLEVKTNAVIAPSNKWILIDENAPQGRKLQLINRASGVANYGKLPSKFYTHYFGLPVFEDESLIDKETTK